MPDGARDDFLWRPAVAADVDALSRLYADAATQLGPQVYSAEQVAAWARFAREAAFEPYVLARDTWLAQSADGRVLGFCGVDHEGEPREIGSFYVRPGLTRRGLGAEMLARTLRRSADARAHAAWATPFSLPVFQRAGFRLAHSVTDAFCGVLFERFRVERR